MDPFPFFVGRGRSGTTLLRAVFDSHPDMAIPDETHFIVGLSRRRRRYEARKGFAIDAFVSDLRTRPGFRSMGVPVDMLVEDLRHSIPRDYPEAIRRVFALYARGRGKARYGDKTPVQVLNMRRLARLFPESRFVHIIRDGREVALSYLDVGWGPDTVEEAAMLWKRAVRAGRRSGRVLGPQRYREVRYEALVDDPQATVRDLCSFLRLDFDPAMLQYHERAYEVVATMGMPEARQGLYLPPTRGMRDWRQMSPAALASFEALAGDLLAELGYSPGAMVRRTTPRLRWRQVQHQVERASSRTSQQVKRARHRLGIR